MLTPHDTNAYKRDIKIIKKRGWKIDKLKNAMNLLIKEQTLPAKLKDHALTGNYKDFRECHIEPDWLLIYQKDSENIYFARTGSHSDLFD